MLSAFSNCLKIPELRARLLFTLGIVFACRLIANVPTPGVDAAAVRQIIDDIQSRVGVGFLGMIDMFSGRALANCAVGALGIMPYISASIIIQLMTTIIPTLERLAREGDVGRQKIFQYVRYLTLVLCVIQGYYWAVLLEHPEQLFGVSRQIVLSPGMGFRLMTVVTMTSGTMLLMWLGEQITARGIGNGISMIITVSIVSRLPSAIMTAANMFKSVEGEAEFSFFHAVGLLVILVLVMAGTIAVTQAQRKVPIQYAKRVVGRKIYGGQNTYMPLRVNYSGVMPIIFAQSILMFPAALLRRAPVEFLRRVGEALSFDTGLYMAMYGLMILFFSYFWVATQFNPLRIADDLKKNGGYVPGIRPGRPTAEHLDQVMTRITLAGAVFLTVIAVVPTIMYQQFRVPWIVAAFFGGTSLLIVVGVMLDTMRQIESHLLMRHYDGFLTRGKFRGRR